MPPLGALMTIRCPDKTAWKRFCHDRVKKHWTMILKRDLEAMHRSELIGTSTTDLNNRIDESLTSFTSTNVKLRLRFDVPLTFT